MEKAERWTETLRCELVDDEVQDRAGQAARAWSEAEQNETELKGLAEEMRGGIKSLRARCGELLRAVRERAEYRLVACEEVPNLGGIDPHVDIVRVDTGEVIRKRPLTPEERQLRLLPEQPVSEPPRDRA